MKGKVSDIIYFFSSLFRDVRCRSPCNENEKVLSPRVNGIESKGPIDFVSFYDRTVLISGFSFSLSSNS